MTAPWGGVDFYTFRVACACERRERGNFDIFYAGYEGSETGDSAAKGVESTGKVESRRAISVRCDVESWENRSLGGLRGASLHSVLHTTQSIHAEKSSDPPITIW